MLKLAGKSSFVELNLAARMSPSAVENQIILNDSGA
jgi:hypothetical protein